MVEFKLTTQAKQIPGTGVLRYPDEMRRANKQGEVLAQFVVDASGMIEPSTYKVLKSDDPAFSEAVREALPTMRFRPGTLTKSDRTLARYFQFLRGYPRAHPSRPFIT